MDISQKCITRTKEETSALILKEQERYSGSLQNFRDLMQKYNITSETTPVDIIHTLTDSYIFDMHTHAEIFSLIVYMSKSVDDPDSIFNRMVRETGLVSPAKQKALKDFIDYTLAILKFMNDPIETEDVEIVENTFKWCCFKTIPKQEKKQS
jgi:hypothetical protein